MVNINRSYTNVIRNTTTYFDWIAKFDSNVSGKQSRTLSIHNYCLQPATAIICVQVFHERNSPAVSRLNSHHIYVKYWITWSIISQISFHAVICQSCLLIWKRPSWPPSCMFDHSQGIKH